MLEFSTNSFILFFSISSGIGFELISTLLGVGIYTVYFLGLVGSSSSSDCDTGGRRVADPNLKAAYQWHALTVAAIIVLCVTVTVVFVRESPGEGEVTSLFWDG